MLAWDASAGIVGEGAAPIHRQRIPVRCVEPTGDVAQQLIEAEMSYVAYVKEQAGSTITGAG